MSCYVGPDVVENGLVFYYDQNNTQKSWKGKPTTNVITNTDLNVGWSQSYNTSILWNDYSPPYGINSQVASFIDADGNGSGYWFSYGDYAPQEPSTTYCISVYARTIGNSWTIEAYTANNTEVGRQYTNSLIVPGDGLWHRLEFDPITTPADTQSDSLSFDFSSMPVNQRCWLCAPQMTPTSIHVPFVNGTRSNTQAILDLTGNNTITANSLTYASDGSFSFDGAGDLLECTNSNILNSIGGTSNVTVESWVNLSGYGSSGYGVITHKGNPWTWLMENLGNTMRIRFTLSTSGDVSCADSSTHALNTWYHFVGTYDGINMKFYRNGVLTNSVAGSGTLGVNTVLMKIGNYGSAYYSQGQIPIVRIYNKTLSANEIQQNFNAIRGRYGL